ncbi:MAG: hypothetical protein KAI47_10400, partial [Deltaproteobacteria bacterium]|nr:hypothetical protein [Deltaproteobacteria bacterium]
PEGIDILANISPDIHHRKPHDHFSGDTYLPVDEAKYAAFVKAAVERYDGDGQDDMPGLKNPVKHWQVSNEPTKEPTNDSTFADLQRITYQAIKSACPDCVVLLGGVSGFPKRYIHGFDDVYKPILSKLNGKYVDVFDFHWYGEKREYALRDTDTGEDVFAHIRTTLTTAGFAPDLPLWITEMGTYSGKPPSNPIMGAFPEQSEQEQARDLFKRHLYPLSRGVKKVFLAFGLIEGFISDDNYFNHTGLIYDGKDPGDLGIGVRKLAYYTYKKMTKMLDGSDWSTLVMLQDPTQDPHVFLGKVTKDSATRYVAWWDTFNVSGYKEGDTTTLSLDTLNGSKVVVTSVIPHSTLGKDVPTAGPTFSTKTESIVSHKTTITLGQDPVIVEVVK